MIQGQALKEDQLATLVAQLAETKAGTGNDEARARSLIDACGGEVRDPTTYLHSKCFKCPRTIVLFAGAHLMLMLPYFIVCPSDR